MSKFFEYIPSWVKKGVRIKVFYKGCWYKGVITSTPEENERGINIKTDDLIDSNNHILSIAVYMATRSPEEWEKLLVKEL